MVNEDVIDLDSRVNVGTKVVVLPMSGARAATDTPVTPTTARRAAAPVTDDERRGGRNPRSQSLSQAPVRGHRGARFLRALVLSIVIPDG